jgi:two-component sensor histidine kinase/DNA-binding LacI/PurR family transcriptional regulator
MNSQGPRKTIGLIMDMFVSWGELDYYQTKLLKGVDDFCREMDVDLLVFVTGYLDSPYAWEKPRNLLFDLVSDKVVDGVIVLPAIGIYAARERLERAVRSFGDLPVVTLGDSFEGTHSAEVDNRIGMKAVVDHLIEAHGKRRVAFIRGTEGNTDAEARYEAYKESLSEHGIPFDPGLVASGYFLFDSGIEAIRLFEERGVEYDSIAAANDNMAIGAMLELGRRGEDALPVVGFDDTEGGKEHSLTTVNQPFREEGYVGARVLYDLMRGRSVPMATLIPSHLVKRSSCGCVSMAVESFLDGGFGIDAGEAEPGIDRVIEGIDGAMTKAVVKEELLLHVAAIGKALDRIGSEGSRAAILEAWNGFLRWAGRNGIGASTVSALVSDFRKGALAKAADAGKALAIDSVFLAMVTHLSERVEMRSASSGLGGAIIANEVDEFGESLFREIDIERQMDLVFEKLPEFGIDSCFVARYADPGRPLERAKALLAYSDGERFEAGAEFETKSLYPASIALALRSKRQSMVVQSLHCGDRQIGYMVSGIGEKVGRRLELIRYRLGIGLEGALAVERLERMVGERTSELLESNARLSKSLAENDILLRELQHRVKNNLNVVASLINLGSSTIVHEGARKVLKDAETRIHSMAEIYEQLYRKPELASDIDLFPYLDNLARSLFATYAIDADRVVLDIEVAALRIDMKRAVSVGLVVNELVSNALKYAWPSGGAGRLTVSLSSSEGRYALSVADDGAGMSGDAIGGRTGSMGLTIVRMLAKDLCAELEFCGEGGTKVELKFPVR